MLNEAIDERHKSASLGGHDQVTAREPEQRVRPPCPGFGPQKIQRRRRWKPTDAGDQSEKSRPLPIIKPRTVIPQLRLSILHKPTSRETSLATELAYTLDTCNWNEGWFSLIPSRIGHSPSVDAATLALIRAQDYAVAEPGVSQKLCRVEYVKAIRTFRESLAGRDAESKDAKVLSAALLACFECMLETASLQMYQHFLGLSSLMEDWDYGHPPSEMATAILYWHWIGNFQIPCALGRPSPYDRPYWLDLDPMRQAVIPADVRKLKRIGHQLLIRLPRLVALVRTLRATRELATQSEAVTLAEDLLQYEDRDGENDLLHKLQVIKTSNIADAAVASYSFHFPDIAVYEALLYYWQTRILLHRLCFTLYHLGEECPQTWTARMFVLETENVRLAANIIMSWQFASVIGRFGAWAMCMAFIAVWGVCVDNKKLKGTSSKDVRKWVLRSYDSLRGVPGMFTNQMMDDAAELLVGGALKGFLVDVFRATR